MAELRLRYFAAAADAAGREEELLAGDEARALRTVGAVRAHLVARYGPAVQAVLALGSVLVDGVVRREDAHPLAVDAGARIDVLPPFAGG